MKFYIKYKIFELTVSPIGALDFLLESYTRTSRTNKHLIAIYEILSRVGMNFSYFPLL